MGPRNWCPYVHSKPLLPIIAQVVIDFHTHVLPARFQQHREDYLRRDATFAALFANPKARIATAEQLLAAMDRAEVDVAVVMGYGWTDAEVAREANDYLLESASCHPQRLVAFCSLNPAWGRPAVYEVERCARGGAKGIGELHPYTQGLDITDREAMAPLMDAARELGLCVLTHASEPVGHEYPGKGHTTPDQLYAFSYNFPDNTIVCAHWGGGLPFYALMPEVGQSLANVYFDSAATPLLYRSAVYSAAVQSAGCERILFGSDYPLVGYHRALGQARESELEPDVQEKVLGGNAAKLLGL